MNFPLSLTLFATALYGSTIVDTFGPGNSYDPSYGFSVGSTNGNGYYIPAVEFAVPGGVSGYLLNSITVAIEPANINGSLHALDLEILTSAGNVPGAVLDTIATTNVPGTYSPTQAPITVFSTLQPFLQANTNYWLAAIAFPTDVAGWADSPNGYSTYAYERNLGTWIAGGFNREPAFELQGTPVAPSVPEPTNLGLISAGLVLTWLLKIRTRRLSFAE